MRHIKKIAASVAALAALGFGGAAIAGAASGGSDTPEPGDTPDVAVTGTQAQRAGDAATNATGGGTVTSVERSDEGGRAAYEVKVDKAGKILEVQVASDNTVVGQQLDDEQSGSEDQGDGDGEVGD